jgi:redox-sensitive bicupin YhaK (pirin superfamily)
MNKPVQGVHRTTDSHWVGNGFPVRTIFSYQSQGLGSAGSGQGAGNGISPFLLLDYAGPAEFTPSTTPRGVGEHPHRGFETVTIVYQGEVEHRDSGGNAGRIGPGDVQWMTAASGIIHEEMHSREFLAQGGPFEVVQLWVNLPKRFKMAPAGYQTLVNADIPVVELANKAGTARVIAGQFQGAKGPARTFTPIDLWDLRLRGGSTVDLTVPEGDTTALFVLKGHVTVNGTHSARDAELVTFERHGGAIRIEAQTEATVLLLNGEPIEEPVVGYGPFVMNSREEIEQAIRDFQRGTFVR